MAESTNAHPPDTSRLQRLLDGYRATCLIVAAVQMNLIEELGRGAVSEEDLAARLPAHLPSLRRFLRGLRLLGLVTGDGGSHTLTPDGRGLLADAPALREMAVLISDEYLPAWMNIAHAVRTGESAFDTLFGMSAWEHRRQNPHLNEAFTRYIGRTETAASRAIDAAYDLSGAQLVVDVGGGRGNALAGLLAKHRPLNGILFDLPHVVEGAEATLRAAGVLERCSVVGGSFFDEVPAGGDVYILRYVLHDWDDVRAAAILNRCRQAMEPGATLLVVEDAVPDDGGVPDAVVMQDLHMMAVLGGRERTEAELADLLGSAAFRVIRRTFSDGTGVIEARAAPEARRS